MTTKIGWETILTLTFIEQLRAIAPEDVPGSRMPEAVFSHIGRLCKAVWLHSGNPADPHAVLTQGEHSDGFVDTLRILRYTNLCRMMAQQLVILFDEVWHGDPPSWVVGSDHAGVALSHSVAEILGAQHDFPEKGPNKTQNWKRFLIEPAETVLQVEELMTTSGTLAAVRTGIRQAHSHPVQFVPHPLVLVHRSDVNEIEGEGIIHLVHYDIKKWQPGDCPWCKQGSKAISEPKKNWEELTARSA
jgi:orotate phosphoribosyltransferase